MVEKICPVCGTAYKANPIRLKYGRETTCSRGCSYTMRARNNVTSEIKPCAVCGTPVTKPPSKRARVKTSTFLCSRACLYKAWGLGLITRDIHTPYNIPVEIRTAQAARMRMINKIKANANGYKRQTYPRLVQWPQGGYGWVNGCSDATRQKISKALIGRPAGVGWVNGCPGAIRQKISIGVSRAIAEGRIPRVSQLEKEVGAVLNQLGIRALPQYVFRDTHGRFGAVVDFFLPDLDTALEVNGTFWHADPRVYPKGPYYPSQIRTAIKYNKKMMLLKGRGIRVAEVWELDYRENPIAAVMVAIK